MPLIEVKHWPKLTLLEFQGRQRPEQSTRNFIRKPFGRSFPELFVRNCARFGMDADTPEDGVQVEFFEYGPDTVNPADIWIKVQFSEDRPKKSERFRIRNEVYDTIVNLFHELNITAPDNIMMDVFWGPTNGCGTVNGTRIEW